MNKLSIYDLLGIMLHEIRETRREQRESFTAIRADWQQCIASLNQEQANTIAAIEKCLEPIVHSGRRN